MLMWVALSGCRDRDGDLPAAYRDLAVPTARLASSEARERGRRLFLQHCALCHGERGDGRGIRHEGFTRPPQDFTDAAWRRRTSPRQVYFVIREGVHGTAMPAWKIFNADETWDLVAYVRSLSRPQ
jgi:mono/diheme cytochrome c family protein